MWKPRPYDPAYADRALELGRVGANRTAIVEGLGASLADLDAWARASEPFAIALADADTLARGHWERRGVEALSATGASFRFAAWARVFHTMFGRAPSDPNRPEPKARVGAKAAPLPQREVITIIDIPDNGRDRKPRAARR